MMRRKTVCFVSLLCTLVNCIPRTRHGHFVDGKHDAAHDHKAFLGNEGKETFDQLTPEESKIRLSKIVDKIDKDNDGMVTAKELWEWIEYIQLNHFHIEVDSRWDNYEKNGDGKISWEEFKNTSYGHVSDDDSRNADKKYRRKRELDKKKWQAADSNKDNMLTKEEYAAFLHPYEYKRMHEAAADETINSIDKDEDGFVSLEEYLGDVQSIGKGENIEKPKWLEEEKKTFKTKRDKDGNGKLNLEETVEWLFPVGYNPINAETKYLISEADANKDKILTKQEILSKQELFVGSRATNFGETFTRLMDEL